LATTPLASDERNSRQQTILHAACRSGNLEMIQLILPHMLAGDDARINLVDHNRNTALMYLCRNATANESTARVTLYALLGEFLKRGANSLLENTKGNTALHKASYNSASFLLSNGALPINIPNVRGQTPLHFAVKGDNRSLVQLLLSYGADLDRPANDGSPLTLSMMTKRREVFPLLQSHSEAEQRTFESQPRLDYKLWLLVFSFLDESKRVEDEKFD
jgi:ankyrin repeat protein